MGVHYIQIYDYTQMPVLLYPQICRHSITYYPVLEQCGSKTTGGKQFYCAWTRFQRKLIDSHRTASEEASNLESCSDDTCRYFCSCKDTFVGTTLSWLRLPPARFTFKAFLPSDHARIQRIPWQVQLQSQWSGWKVFKDHMMEWSPANPADNEIILPSGKLT